MRIAIGLLLIMGFAAPVATTPASAQCDPSVCSGAGSKAKKPGKRGVVKKKPAKTLYMTY